MERESLRRSRQIETDLRTNFQLIIEAGMDSAGVTHLRCQVRGTIHAGTASSVACLEASRQSGALGKKQEAPYLSGE